MTDWQVAEAKNRFSELITRAIKEGPQRITRRDEAVIVMSAAAFAEVAGRPPEPGEIPAAAGDAGQPLAPQDPSARVPLILEPGRMSVGRHEFHAFAPEGAPDEPTARDPASDAAPDAASRRVLLIIGGGIAAYKSLELIRLLRKAGIGVRAILTRAGEEFVTPLSVGSLTGDKVYQDLFSLTDEAEMGHIELSRSADFIVVAPATADLIARAAQGLAGDLAATTLLATDKDVLMAPSMNVRMWLHPATQRNVARLRADGIRFVGPDDGDMACGEYGPGRLAEPADIAAAVVGLYAARARGRPLAGKRVIVTAGPTLEPIDPVRFLSNRSSGKQGYAIAAALAALGADVVLVSGPVALAPPAGAALVRVETASEMAAACEAALPADAAICVAAVADWRPDEPATTKIKKDAHGNAPTIRLTENPDILAGLSKSGPRRPSLVIGFAAETDRLEQHARAKLAKKGCDWIVANDVSGDVMGGAENEVILFRHDSVERWPRMGKDRVAAALAQAVARALAGAAVAPDAPIAASRPAADV